MIEILNTKSSYKHYKDTRNGTVDVRTYLKIIHGFIKFIMDKVFDGFDVHLSNSDSLGVIGIRGTKVKPYVNEDGEIKGVAPSWSKTRALWNENPEAKERGDIIYCFNEHSGGIKYRLVWHKDDMKLHNKTYYYLKFSRANRRRMWAIAIKGEKEYMVLE